MFNSRGEHKAYISVAAGFSITGVTMITLSLFGMYAVGTPGYRHLVLGMTGSLLLLAALGLDRYVKWRMSG